MPLSGEQIERLAEKRLAGTISPEEQALLEEWLHREPGDKMFWNAADADEEALRKRLLARIKEDAGIGQNLAPVRSMHSNRWWWAAAAAILVAVSAYFFVQHTPAEKQISATAPVPGHDIKAPATNRAMITLAGGQKIFLDSAGNGQLAQQGNMKLVKLADGQVAYQMADGSMSGVEAYNTLTNPRGSKVIDMTLSDGSHVWLNAGSSITYPVAFTGSERKVSVTGEAYFEVAHHVTTGGAKQSFIVEKGDMQVTVLGTHFNVNAYDDEENIKVTLLEGSVKTSNSFGDVMLKPGQQATITKKQKPETRNDIDLEQVTAWRYDKFQFGEKADIGAIMRQIARWYDVDIEYQGTVSVHFGGRISRRANVSEVLEKLAMTGSVKFRVEGGKIIVIP